MATTLAIDDELLTATQQVGGHRTKKDMDFLICAIALRRDFAIFTTDHDFGHFARILHLRIYEPRAS